MKIACPLTSLGTLVEQGKQTSYTVHLTPSLAMSGVWVFCIDAT